MGGLAPLQSGESPGRVCYEYGVHALSFEYGLRSTPYRFWEIMQRPGKTDTKNTSLERQRLAYCCYRTSTRYCALLYVPELPQFLRSWGWRRVPALCNYDSTDGDCSAISDPMASAPAPWPVAPPPH